MADNIFVLRPGFKNVADRPAPCWCRQLQPVLDSLGAGVRADAYADSLTSFQRVVVELVKALVAGSRLVILREISTIISDMEMARLGEILRRYAEQGLSFLYIGYHYEEMVQICDRTAVFSGGRIIKIMRPEDGNVPYEELYMRRVREQIRQPRPRAARKPCWRCRACAAERCAGCILPLRPESAWCCRICKHHFLRSDRHAAGRAKARRGDNPARRMRAETGGSGDRRHSGTSGCDHDLSGIERGLTTCA